MANQEDDGCTKRKPYRFSPTFPVIDGIIQFPGTTREFLQEIKNLPVQGDEVFVATYPRVGTTWTSEIVWQVLLDGKIDSRPIQNRVPFVEIFKTLKTITTEEKLVDIFRDKPFPRVFKSHLPYQMLPMGDGVTKPKYINVIRNPKDCAVSNFHHTRNLTFFEFEDGTWEEFFEMFMEAEVHYGSWFDHVLGWWEHRDDPNILILKYEDMKKDLPTAVKQVAKFVGKVLSEETIQLIAKQTSFDAMSKGDGRFYDGFKSKVTRIPGATKFMRKGEVGDWKKYFTEEQNRRFDEVYEKRMAGSGLELEFE